MVHVDMDLETHLLETLRLRSAGQGLTHGELREKCGPAWRRELARFAGQSGEEASLSMVKDFVHRLWTQGRVLIEPPAGEGKSVRVWHPDEAGTPAESLSSPRAPEAPGESEADAMDRIGPIYERLAREGRSPYVFLSHLHRETGLPLDLLHRVLRREQEAGRAVLSIGDWASATREERAAALESGGRQFVKVRLVRERQSKDGHGPED